MREIAQVAGQLSSVAQMAFAHLLNLTRQLDVLARRVPAGQYREAIESLLSGAPLRKPPWIGGFES